MMWRWLVLGLLLAGLAGQATAFGIDQPKRQYTGELVPNNMDLPIAILLELPEGEGRIEGRATLGPPVSAVEQKVIGDANFQRCNLKVDLGSNGYFHLSGICDAEGFIGVFQWYVQEKVKKRGGMMLQTKKIEAPRTETPDKPIVQAPRLTMVMCIKQSSNCLLGCPKGDYDSEFLCANHCRKKEESCKKKLRDLQKLAVPH